MMTAVTHKFHQKLTENKQDIVLHSDLQPTIINHNDCYGYITTCNMSTLSSTLNSMTKIAVK